MALGEINKGMGNTLSQFGDLKIDSNSIVGKNKYETVQIPASKEVRIQRAEVARASKDIIEGSENTKDNEILVRETLKKAGLGKIARVGSEIKARAFELEYLVGELKNTNQNLTNKLESVEEHKSKLHSELLSAEQILRSRNSRIKELEKDLAYMQTSHDEKSEEYKKIKEELETAHKESAETKTLISLYEEKEQKLLNQIKELKTKIEENSANTKTIQPEVQAKLDESFKRVGELSNQLDAARMELESAKKESHKNNTNYKEFVDKLLKTIQLLEAELSEREDTLMDLESTFKNILDNGEMSSSDSDSSAARNVSKNNSPNINSAKQNNENKNSFTLTPAENFRFKSLEDFRKPLEVKQDTSLASDLLFIEKTKAQMLKYFDDSSIHKRVKINNITLLLSNLKRRVHTSANTLYNNNQKGDANYLNSIFSGEPVYDEKGVLQREGAKIKRYANGFDAYVNQFLLKPLHENLQIELDINVKTVNSTLDVETPTQAKTTKINLSPLNTIKHRNFADNIVAKTIEELRNTPFSNELLKLVVERIKDIENKTALINKNKILGEKIILKTDKGLKYSPRLILKSNSDLSKGISLRKSSPLQKLYDLAITIDAKLTEESELVSLTAEPISPEVISNSITPIQEYNQLFIESLNPEVAKKWNYVRLIQQSRIAIPRSPLASLRGLGLDSNDTRNADDVRGAVFIYKREADAALRALKQMFPNSKNESGIEKLIEQYKNYIIETDEFIKSKRGSADYPKLKYFNQTDKENLSNLITLYETKIDLAEYAHLLETKSKPSVPDIQTETSTTDEVNTAVTKPSTTTNSDVSTSSVETSDTIESPISETETESKPELASEFLSLELQKAIRQQIKTRSRLDSTRKILNNNKQKLKELYDDNERINKEIKNVDNAKRNTSDDYKSQILIDHQANHLANLKAQRRVALEEIEETESLIPNLEKEVVLIEKDLELINLTVDSISDQLRIARNEERDRVTIDIGTTPQTPKPDSELPEPVIPKPELPQLENRMYQGPSEFDIQYSQLRKRIISDIKELIRKVSRFEESKEIPAFSPQYALSSFNDQRIAIRRDIDKIVYAVEDNNPKNKDAWVAVIKGLEDQYKELQSAINAISPASAPQTTASRQQSNQSRGVQPKATQTTTQETQQDNSKSLFGRFFKRSLGAGVIAIGAALGSYPTNVESSELKTRTNAVGPADISDVASMMNKGIDTDVKLNEDITYNPKQNVLRVNRVSFELNKKEVVRNANPARIFKGEVNLNKA